MDLIRDLLLQVEENPEMDGRTDFRFTPDEFVGHSAEEISYHIKMLIEGGHLKGNISTAVISRLTWDGHEFLDNIRDPGTRAKTKERFKGLPGVGLSVIAELAKAELKKHLGLP